MSRLFFHSMLLILVLGLAGGAVACTACVGDADDDQTKGVNAAIFVMLGGMGCLAMAVGAFIWTMKQRVAQFEESIEHGGEVPC